VPIEPVRLGIVSTAGINRHVIHPARRGGIVEHDGLRFWY
jgi:hypothetical protein